MSLQVKWALLLSIASQTMALFPTDFPSSSSSSPLPASDSGNCGGTAIDYDGPVTTNTSPLLDFLQRLQETAFNTFGPNNFDPKLYVDLPLKFDLSTTQQAFAALPASTQINISNGGRVVSAEDLRSFIDNYFNSAGDDLEYLEPLDFVAEPQGFLPKVKNQEVRAWALQLHSLWKILSKKVSGAVYERPELHTLLPLPEPCMIPGSRFREVYYWDSYWVIRGLLASKMYGTAKAIVTNLMSLVDEYGFVLNGARIYYTNRSQPPLLSSMIYDIYQRTGDLSFVEKSLPVLLKEYIFWNSGMHKVTVDDSNACTHNLSRYYAMWDKPRPESFTIDTESASNLSDVASKHSFYRELASAAESGWDFSTRWMRIPSDLTTLAATSVIPVDLNAFLLKMELDIASLASVVGDSSTSEQFSEASRARQKAFDSVFWNDSMGQWLDCWLSDSSTREDERYRKGWQQNQKIFASNFVPLWIGLLHTDGRVEKLTRSLKSSGLLCAAGITTSLTDSGQQWDFPNGWAPLQHVIIEGLAKSGSEEARSMAEDLSVRWIKTNYAGYKKSGVMYEKYNVQKCGDIGSGGEYNPQTGFGWTNGVVLSLLEEFGWPENERLDCEFL